MSFILAIDWGLIDLALMRMRYFCPWQSCGILQFNLFNFFPRPWAVKKNRDRTISDCSDGVLSVPWEHLNRECSRLSAVNCFWGVASGDRGVPGWPVPTTFRQPPPWEVQWKHLSPELLCGKVNKPWLLWWFQKWDCCPQSAVFCPFRGQPLAFKVLFSNAETEKRQMLTGVFPDTSPGPWQDHFPPTVMK